jgi:hypothetical protein
MSDLGEREIIDCLRENLALAAANCDRLAAGQRGPIYRQLRDQLRRVEGAARQLSAWRGDTRWLRVGLQMAEAQRRCGEWLRKHEPAWRFQRLAQALRTGEIAAHHLETARTGRSGPILPKPLPAPHRDTRPVAVVLPSGLIIPAGVSVH